MKKGLAIPIGGIIALVISIVVLAVLTVTMDVPYTTAVALKGESAASNLNELEMMRKMIPEGMKVSSQRVAYDLGKIGSEREFWTKTSPDIVYIRNKLNEHIGANIPKNTVGNHGRTIEWEDPQLQIIDGDKFTVRGYITFTLKDSVIFSEARSNITFDHEIDSSYIKLSKIGRKVVEDPEYRAILESTTTIGDKAAQILTKLRTQHTGIIFDVTVSGNDLDITIEDPNSLVPITQEEMTDLGKTTPFDTLKIRFKTAAFQ